MTLLLVLWTWGCRASGLLGADAGAPSGAHDPSDGGTGTGVTDPTFVPVDPQVSLRKVKAVLTGGTPTAAEYAAYGGSASALGTLVDGWLHTDAARAVLTHFFSVQLQQAQMQAEDFPAQMYDQDGVQLGDTLAPAMRQSFGRTVMALLDEGAPLTAIFTTRRFMMTTEMMGYYAYTDTSLLGDDRVRRTRWARPDPKFGPTFRQAAGPVSLSDAANPNGPNYLTFYWPKLTSSYDNNDAATARTCAGIDPVVFTAVRAPGGAAEWPINVWNLLQGSGNFFGQILYFYPGGGGLGGSDVLCQAFNHDVARIWTTDDANDWRMVQVRAPEPGEAVTEFFDLPRLRGSNELVMQAERVGFFTTPAFLSQWGTNASNSARAAANQTLIVALGQQIDGNDTLPLTTPTAVDANHAREPACFACHQTLDPLRQYFRQTFTDSYSRQQDANQTALPAAFAFRGHTAAGLGAQGLADALAGHPKFAAAWTLKLCAWANSAPCDPDDPEVVRIAAAFAASNYDFYAMARALLASPLVTYAAPTRTAQQGRVASLARHHQLCATLGERLGLLDPCNLGNATADGTDTLPARAAALPSDGYSRGVASPLYVTAPEPFYVGNVENICALAAAQAVDGPAGWASSSEGDAAVDKLVQVLMGVPAAEAQMPTAALREHVAAARAAGQSATVALRSAFVAACSSAAVVTVGQ